MNKPLVSVIVPTRNSAQFLEACLESVIQQSYRPLELIVVDRNSTDQTLEIAKRYTDKIYNKEPERSTQRNYGAQKSSGKYVLFLDSDMQLAPEVLSACVEKFAENPDLKGIIIPEESFGEGFWAQCKRLERSFYVGVDWIEAARFFERRVFDEVGGYDETLVSGEDWDLSQRVAKRGRLGRVSEYIHHDEGRLHLFKTLRKKSYYAHKFTRYTAVTVSEHHSSPYRIVLKRFGLFLSKPHVLFRNPLLGTGMLFMKTMEYAYGAFGYLAPKKESDET